MKITIKQLNRRYLLNFTSSIHIHQNQVKSNIKYTFRRDLIIPLRCTYKVQSILLLNYYLFRITVYFYFLFLFPSKLFSTKYKAPQSRSHRHVHVVSWGREASFILSILQRRGRYKRFSILHYISTDLYTFRLLKLRQQFYGEGRDGSIVRGKINGSISSREGACIFKPCNPVSRAMDERKGK